MTESKSVLGGEGRGGMGSMRRDSQVPGTFGGDGNAYYFDHGNGFTSVYTCQNIKWYTLHAVYVNYISIKIWENQTCYHTKILPRKTRKPKSKWENVPLIFSPETVPKTYVLLQNFHGVSPCFPKTRHSMDEFPIYSLTIQYSYIWTYQSLRNPFLPLDI